MKRGLMASGELILLLAVIIAIFGIYKFKKDQDSEGLGSLKVQRENQARADFLSDEIKELSNRLDTLNTKFSDEAKQLDAVQEQLSKLGDDLLKKETLLKVLSPIAIELTQKPPPLPAKKTKLSAAEVQLIREHRAKDKLQKALKPLSKKIKELSK